ncbi:MAG: potassium-transporting ATPase subunit KdpC [Gemmatimonadaceae bacterium]|nr:potassium-transporting ATPase subunit KdpC [Gemmatimonadaceae bacterium]
MSLSLRLNPHLRPALVLTLVLTVLTGLLYPGLVTLLAQTLFPAQANGSLVVRNGRRVGSALIGQAFRGAGYLHPRPSAAGGGYDASASSGSNKGPTDSTLAAQIAARVDSAVADGATRGRVPADLVTASASGLDPDLSPASAQLQAARVATARRVPLETVKALITAHITPRQFGVLGEPRVNVLAVNLALDSAFGVGRP